MQRFDRSTWAVLSAALLLLLISYAAAFARVSLPTEGWVKGQTRALNGNYVAERLPSGSPLQPGDVLVAIDGRPVSELRSLALRLSAHAPGPVAQYTVEREGQRLEIPVLLQRPHWSSIFTGMPEPYRSLILPVLMGALAILWLRPRDAAARLFFLICIVQVAHAPHKAAGPADLFYPFPFWGGTLLTTLLTIFAGPLFLHLYLLFPTPKRFVALRPRLTAALLYLTGPLLCLGALAIGGVDAFWPNLLRFERLLYPIIQLLVPLILLHSWLTNRERSARLKVEWVALSILLTMLGSLLLSQITDSAIHWLLALAVNLLSPALLGLAVLGALPRLEQAAQQALLWALLLGALGGIYWTLDYLLRLGGDLRGEPLPVTLTSLIATLFTALFFQPLRTRIGRAIRSLWEGDRTAAYGTLTALSARLGATLAPTETLRAIVETVAEALQAEQVAIELISDGEVVATESTGSATTEAHRLPITYQGDEVGRLILAARSLTAIEERLLTDLLTQAGAALYAIRLTADLQQSRQRLVLAREEERRRLHRDLHDGLGPQLAGLTLMLEGARNRLAHLPDAALLLTKAAEQIQATIAEVRQVVYALRPPALDELGLVGALEANLLRHGAQNPQILIEAPHTLPPLSAAVEVAAYRILQEAVNNVRRHAGAQHCWVEISCAESRLHLSVTDDGRGFTPTPEQAGVGLHSMRERAAELGGSFAIEPRPQGGTSIRVELPCLSREEGAA